MHDAGDFACEVRHDRQRRHARYLTDTTIARGWKEPQIGRARCRALPAVIEYREKWLHRLVRVSPPPHICTTGMGGWLVFPVGTSTPQETPSYA